MPWERKTVEESRMTFIREYLKGEESKSALCKKHGISRPTGDLWIKRYERGEGISDLSRAPRSHPLKTSDETEQAILAFRAEHPGTGARKIRIILERRGIEMPSVNTVNAILKRNGCISKAASQAAEHYQRFVRQHPNSMWQADFKGHFALKDGTRCHPLNVIDDNSRYCICSVAQETEQLEETKKSFEAAFRQYGLPKRLLCDNGNPWGTSQSAGYTRFEVWLMDLNIQPVHGRPLHPQTQGKEERFNGSQTREMLNHTDMADLAEAQKKLDEYREYYNQERPHEALAMKTPSEVYQPSTTPYPEKIAAWDYTVGHIRKIKSTGFLTFEGQGYFLSEAFGDKVIAVVPTEEDGICHIVYRNYCVACIDQKERCIISRKISKLKSQEEQK